LYLAEFGKVNRYEAAGGLAGLMRVREFTQDDAHIFCTEDQLESEVVKILRFIKDIYGKFGFDKITMKLATRPLSEFRIGSDEIWDKAEGALKHALDANGIEYEIAENDAAFYGPKIDNYLKDSMGRVWQCGTVQLDMNLPERFDLSYIGEDGEKHRPIMLHRAMLGSIERFMGILLESTGGNLPLWLSPEPVVVVPISEKYRDYAESVVADLRAAGIYARAGGLFENRGTLPVAVLAVGGKESVELPLGEHGGAQELLEAGPVVARQADQPHRLAQKPGRRAGDFRRRTVRGDFLQGALLLFERLLDFRAFLAPRGARLPPAGAVDAVRAGERGAGGAYVRAARHDFVLVLRHLRPGRAAEKRKRDRVEDGRLAGAGVAGDQEKPFFLELIKSYFRYLSRIRTEGADFQTNRLHVQHLPLLLPTS
jgi:hypothetical protein